MKESKTILNRLSKKAGVVFKLNSLINDFRNIKAKVINTNAFLFLRKEFLFGYGVSVKKLAVSFVIAFKFLTVEVNSIFHYPNIIKKYIHRKQEDEQLF